MGRLIMLAVFLAAVVAGIYFYRNFETEVRQGEQGLEYIKIARRSDQQPQRPAAAPRPPVRIATFNLSGLTEKKLATPGVSGVLVKAIVAFDVVAVQDVRSKNQASLVRLVDQVNATGARYQSAVCPSVKRDGLEQYAAFVFDEERIEIDPNTVHCVADPAGSFRHRPLVALFRVKGPQEAEAFTFKLVNVHTDPQRTGAELDLLDDVYRAVRDDGSGEDDVILLGGFGADHRHLGQLGQVPHITSAVTGTPTNVRDGRAGDNILLNRRATTEFTGRAGVMDLMRRFDLTLQGTLEVSDHLPVWAEFSSFEGGGGLQMAAKSDRKSR